MRAYDLVIVGSGSVGLPLAYYCAARGMRVAVVDREASWGRGQNRAAIGGIRATHSEPAKIRICRESIEIASRFAEEHGIDIEWRRGGYLFAAYDEERERSLGELLALQRSAGLDIGWIGPKRVAELCPGIREEGLRGGSYSPGDGSASPLRAATAFHALAVRAGAEFFFGEEALRFDVERGRITRLVTDKGSHAAWAFVDAAGAAAAAVARAAGTSIPVRPDCHEAGVTEPVARFMEPMLVDLRPDAESGNFYFYQSAAGQVVFCITPRPPIWGEDRSSTSTFLPLCVRRMLELYPRLAPLRVRRTWRGCYPMTPDGQPLVGWAGEPSNLLVAAGMCGQGFMLGPGLGRLLSRALDGEGSLFEDALAPLSPRRAFGRAESLE